jgi:hypothetical protein
VNPETSRPAKNGWFAAQRARRDDGSFFNDILAGNVTVKIVAKNSGNDQVSCGSVACPWPIAVR